mmetsp:Transcript_26036/g.53287  ORF Transcript_26036/g.53287 Transcript_26036/m.53287 type:complete len:89 (-) Transcript_26036:181-447(-)
MRVVHLFIPRGKSLWLEEVISGLESLTLLRGNNLSVTRVTMGRCGVFASHQMERPLLLGQKTGRFACGKQIPNKNQEEHDPLPSDMLH